MKGKIKMAALCASLAVGVCNAAPVNPMEQPPEVCIPRAADWNDIEHMAGMDGIHALQAKKLISQNIKFYIGTNGKSIFFVSEAEVGPGGIRQRGRTPAMVIHDDTYEFVFVPRPDDANAQIYHMIINNRGGLYAVGRKNGQPVSWKPDVKYKGEIKDNKWTFRLEIPCKDFGLDKLVPGKPFGLRFAKNWVDMIGAWQTNWSQVGTAYFQTALLPYLSYSPKAPAVHKEIGIKENKPYARITINNSSASAQKYHVKWLLQPSSSQGVDSEFTVTVAGKEKKLVPLAIPQFMETEHAKACVIVSSADKKTVYYRRAINWDRTYVTKFRDLKSKDSERIALKYAVYPYSNQMFIRIDPSGCPPGTKLGKVTAEVKDAKGKVIATGTLKKRKTGLYDLLLDLPDLAAITKKNKSPDYTLTVRTSGIKDGVFTRKFKRHVFKWERNKLGKSTHLIIPPYTPLEVKGRDVYTILRQHTVNDLGMWAQVKANGQEIFKKGGIRLEVVEGKKVHRAKGSLKFTEKKPHIVKSRSTWSAGNVKGSTLCEWDYDGMMKLYLTLAPGKADKIRIVIPFPAGQAKLFHATCDGLRHNYAGYVPAGKGVVWKSSQAPRNGLLTSYLPYIWTGTEKSGFCVFGENDKNWGVSKKVDAQEVIRHKDGSVDLVLNIIPETMEWKKSRTLLIGFQATPVKPRPADWRLHWPGWHYGQIKRDGLLYNRLKSYMTWYGSGYYWGNDGGGQTLYPVNENVAIWKEFKRIRGTGKISETFLKKWMEQHKNRSAAARKTFYNHVKLGLRFAAGATPKSNITFYTNARGGRFDTPQGVTFQDEWMKEIFQATRDREPLPWEGKAYSVDNSESFRDFALWWYNKMITLGGTENLYWDDVFLSATLNLSKEYTQSGRYDNDELIPTCGLFNMRELIKRAAIHQLELGRKPWNMVHMTNTYLVPVYSFAQTHLDWENVSTRPYQEQYSREYLRAASIGVHTGNVIGVIGNVGGGSKEQKDWVKRTGTGVTITHDLTRSAPEHAGKEYWKAISTLFEFGYGLPEVKIYNYWDDNYPIEITGGESSSILLRKGNEAMIVLCDYRDGGTFKIKFRDGLRPVSAKNMETRKAYKVSGGVVEVPLKKYDFNVIYIKGE